MQAHRFDRTQVFHLESRPSLVVPVPNAPPLGVLPNIESQALHTPFRIHFDGRSSSLPMPLTSATPFSIFTCIPDAWQG